MLYGAITGINHTNANGYGKIADFKFQVNNSLTTPANIHLSFSDYQANDASGAALCLIPLRYCCNKSIHGITETNNNNSVTLSPILHQSTDNYERQRRNKKHKDDGYNRTCGTHPPSSKGAGGEVINLSSLSNGIYFAEIQTGKEL